MSQGIHRLTDSAARNAAAAEKPQKLSDGAGLYLLVEPSGAKYWRMAYRFAGKQRLLALGVYPDATLKAARIAATEAREKLRNGIDPNELRRLRKATQQESLSNSFSAIAHEWFAKQKPAWAETHCTKVKWMLEKNLFPRMGSRPIAEITPPELLTTLRRIEGRGAIETAKRVKQVAGQVFRFAIATGRAQRDPSQDLRGALAAPVRRHLAAITDPKAVGPLLLALDGYIGSDVVRGALRLAPLTFVRPGELRQARWVEIDFEAMEWRLPAERMKTRLPHIVPLSTQAVEVLRELQPITGHSEYLFPSPRSPRRPMSNNAVLAAMRRLGIEKDVMCGHGFRAMARTIMDEVLGYRVDWIEHQLAHAVKDANGRAYNRTAHLEKRKEMMQGWANYLDVLRERAAGGNVIAIRSTGSSAFGT
jgi:integrase